MLGSFGMTMVLLNDLVHHGSEGSVRIVRSSVDTNARVNVLST